jgi:SAM-dependent MidA family methyltransferase
VHEALRSLGRGRVVVVDYTVTDAELAAGEGTDWLRTYRGHERGTHPLDEPGGQDVTADVAVDQLRRAVPGATLTTQAELLRRHGIDDLVEEGRQVWSQRAHLGDLAAVAARSRVREAEALLDPAGLGAFGVLEWVVGEPAAAPAR